MTRLTWMASALLQVLLTAMTSGAAFAKANYYPACGVISRDGRFAAALSAAHALDLEISRRDGTTLKTKMALETAADNCRLRFDQRGQYLAVGVRLFDGGNTWLRLGVFDTYEATWISLFEVKPEPDLMFPVRLEGFLEDTSNLVVTGFGRGSYHNPEKSAIRVAILSPNGRLLEPILARTVLNSYFNWDTDFADVANNRLWFNHDPRFCPLSSISLTGPVVEGPTVDEGPLGTLACDLQEAVGFPDRNTLVGAVTRSDKSWVWQVDLSERKGEKLELPEAQRGRSARWNQYHFSDELPMSPDGQVFAITRSVTTWDVADHAHFGSGEIYVIQLRPMRLLGAISPRTNCGPAAVAVDHRNGQTSVLAHQCRGGWKLIPVPQASTK